MMIQIDDYQFALANIPEPIPGNEVEEIADLNILWQMSAAAQNVNTKHEGHVIVDLY